MEAMLEEDGLTTNLVGTGAEVESPQACVRRRISPTPKYRRIMRGALGAKKVPKTLLSRTLP
jgi:hypothetical protein